VRTPKTGIPILLLAVTGAIAADTPALRLVQPQVSFSEDGQPADGQFQPGENVYLSAFVAGYQLSAEKIHVTYRLTVTDPQGIPIIEPVSTDIADKLSPQDKNWKPRIREVFSIPSIAPPGDYKAQLTVKDAVSGQSIAQDIAIPVRGRAVEPSPTLVVRNFGFYRGEDDPHPLTTPAYAPGATVYARFDITGYKLGPGNSVEVSYGVALVNAEGTSLYSQPVAATERTSGFYPQPYVPAGMTLNLDKTIRPGTYTLVISLADAKGSQNAEQRFPFQVAP
jgi:hypothetical protein